MLRSSGSSRCPVTGFGSDRHSSTSASAIYRLVTTVEQEQVNKDARFMPSAKCVLKQAKFIYWTFGGFLLLQFSNCEEIPEEELVIVLLVHDRAARNIE